MGERQKTVCFSGHRALTDMACEALPSLLERTVEQLVSRGFDTFLAGGALGFDTLAAIAVLRVREKQPHIRLELVLPCADQAVRWSQTELARYEAVRKRADAETVLAPHYYNGCMQVRNRALVENSSVCVCYLEKNGGGTAQTVRLAEKAGLEIINLATGQPAQLCMTAL